MTHEPDGRLTTGIRNLDTILDGGLPRGSITVVSGPPGSGKTVLAQQVCFHNAGAGRRALYFSTLSEPAAKTLRYLRPFSFFDQAKVDDGVELIDLAGVLATKSIAQATSLVLEHVRRARPEVVVVDSFKVFDDLAPSAAELRRFSYELAVSVMAWECTTLLLGEYGLEQLESSPLFSVTDGLILLAQRDVSGESQRLLKVMKMRGAAHSRDEFTFSIGRDGLTVFAPRLTVRREPRADVYVGRSARCATGIARLDALLGPGIPRGSSVLVGGAAGTGKTVLLLEFIYRGALQGEKGVLFSFEESPERLLAAAAGLGWDLAPHLASGAVTVEFVPRPDVTVEAHLVHMRERVEALGATRIAIDTMSIFLEKVIDSRLAREKVFQLASIVQNLGAVGLFALDIPYGSSQLGRFGVEETAVDGVILLTSTAVGPLRERHLEVYKLRNTAHATGRHPMHIGPGGIDLAPAQGA